MFRTANDRDIELQDLNNKEERRQKTARNNLWDSIVGFIDAIDLGAIYTMFLKPTLHTFLEETGKYFMFPIAAAASVIKAVLSWRQAYIDRGKTRSVVSAVVETVAALAITTAVVGALVASTVFALATPIIFTATMAGKTLFHAGSAIYFAGKAAGAKVPEKKEKYRTLAKQNAIGAVAGLVATAAVATVFLLGKIALAGIGIAGAVIGGTLAVIKGYKSYKAAQAAPAAPVVEHRQEEEPEWANTQERRPGSPLAIAKGLGASRESLERAAQRPSIGSVAPQTSTLAVVGTPTQVATLPEDEQPLLGHSSRSSKK